MITIDVHIDALQDGSVAWWAKTDSHPTLSIAADSLQELEFLAREAVLDLRDEQGLTDAVVIRFNLVADQPTTGGDSTAIDHTGLLEPAGEASAESRVSKALELVGA